MEIKEPSYNADRNANCLVMESVWRMLKTQKLDLRYDSKTPQSTQIQKQSFEKKPVLQFTAALFAIVSIWKEPVCTKAD